MGHTGFVLVVSHPVAGNTSHHQLPGTGWPLSPTSPTRVPRAPETNMAPSRAITFCLEMYIPVDTGKEKSFFLLGSLNRTV